MKRRLLLTTALSGIAMGARAALKDDVGNTTVVSPLTNLTTSFSGLTVNGSSPTITLTSVPTTGVVSSGVSIGFTYAVAAPSGLTAVWNPGAISGAVSGFSASGGSGGAVVTAPGSAGTYTLSVTGTGSNTASATAPNTTVVGAGGAVPMPSTSNRPQFNAGTKLLSWSGPVGGGPSNGTYTPQTRTLTNATLTGSPPSLQTSSAGQVIQGLFFNPAITANTYLSGVIVVNHNNVTIKQCATGSTVADAGDLVMVFISPGVTGTVIEDCYMDANNRNGGGGTDMVSGNGGLFDSITARRNTFVRVEQAISSPTGAIASTNFTENLCTLIGGTDADWVEIYPRGGNNKNILVQYNLFDGTDNAGGGFDSGVNMTTGSGLPTGTIGPNILIDTNWFVNVNSAHPLVADDTGPPSGHLNFGFTNNGYFGSFSFNGTASGLHGPSSSVSPNSGNFVMTSATSTSGALVNGTGVIT